MSVDCGDKVRGGKVGKDAGNNDLSPAANSAVDAVVLKFGSSVLTDVTALKTVVTEIYRHARYGRKVVAVVSAFLGETDKLYEEASSLGATAQSRHAPRLIALGEERSAALLAIACDASGLDARVLGARALSLYAGGALDDAHPQSLDVSALLNELENHDVVIVPGFVALGATGEPVLLGRGGSDLTAVFIAHALNLGDVTLVKDVDGVYDQDPAKAGDSARFFQQLDYDKARDVAGKLLQPKAITFAERRDVAINVVCANAAAGTKVSKDHQEPSSPAPKRKLRVAVAGLGLIGEGAAIRIQQDEQDYELVAALVRDDSKPRHDLLREIPVYTDPIAFLAEKPDVIIDALPSGEVGKQVIRAALKQGTSIITANKQAAAGSMAEFHEVARDNDAVFAYSASVGGGSPMVEAVRQANAIGAEIESINAIVNGTVNFILDAVKNGSSYDKAIKDAQEAGFAEPDPTADLSGEDARAKIAILTYDAFGHEIDLEAIEVEALTGELADKFASEGGAWKQLSHIVKATDGSLSAKVSFQRVDDDAHLAGAIEEANALRAVSTTGRSFTAKGKGAGRRPTVESLLADLGEIKRRYELVQPIGKKISEAG